MIEVNVDEINDLKKWFLRKIKILECIKMINEYIQMPLLKRFVIK